MAVHYKLCACGKSFTTTRKNVRWHSNKCRLKFGRGRATRKRRVLAYAAGGYHTYEEWQAKLVEHKRLCYWCQQELVEESASRDHLTPLSRGGSDSIENIVPSCFPCNTAKGAKTEAEYREYLLLIRPRFTNSETALNAVRQDALHDAITKLADAKRMDQPLPPRRKLSILPERREGPRAYIPTSAELAESLAKTAELLEKLKPQPAEKARDSEGKTA